ncbi:hypothetical protein BH11CYA1_BH11CYA1_04690 [soil metagenome]
MFQLASVQPASAQDSNGRQVKDFRHRKRLIVPAGDSERRIDYQALPGRDSLMLPTYAPKFPPAGAGSSSPRYSTENGYQPSSGADPYASGLPPGEPGELSATTQSLGNSSQTGRKPMTRTSRAGLTPPPPPITSGLLPSSLTKELPTKTTAEGHTAGQTLSAQKVAQIKSQAESLVKKGKVSEAQTLLTGYVKNYPQQKVLATELSKVSLERAKGHAKAGNHEAAAQQARLAITHGENAPEVVQSAHGTLNSSLQKIGVKANSPADRFDLGTKLMGQARYDEAVIEYSAAAKLKPSVEAYLGAGGAAMKGGHQLQAKKYFQEALEVNPDSQPALRELGIARYHLKDYAGANADLTRALVINSGDKEAAHTLIELWHHQVASRPGDANAHLGLARAYQVAGDLPAAQDAYKTVVKIQPQHPNLPAARQSFKLAYARQESRKAYELAQTLERQGSLLSAYQKAGDAVQLFPSETLYQKYSADLAAKLAATAQNSSAAPMFNTAAPTDGAPATPSQQAILVPGSTPEAPPSLIPTAQDMGLAPAAAPLSSSGSMGQGGAGEPLSTDRQVSSISNFLVSMRNFTMQQQNAIRDAEDNSIWTKGTTRAKSSLAGLGSDADSDVAIAAPSGLPSALPSGLPSAIQAAPPSSAVADVLRNAALALANTKSSAGTLSSSVPALSGTATSMTSATSSQASSLTSALPDASAASVAAPAAAPIAAAAAAANPYKSWAIQAAQASAQKAAHRFSSKSSTTSAANAKPVAATSTSAQMASTQSTSANQAPAPSPTPLEAPPQSQAYGQDGYQQSAPPQYDQISQINSLQTNNQQLQAQLSQANSYIQQLQSRNAPMSEGLGASSQPNLSSAPALSPALPSTQALSTTQAISSQSTGTVRLLLQGVKAAKDDVQLKVLLRNETSQEIKIPSNMKASVRSASQGERQGKASFSGKTVSPGASVAGIIKIPGNNLDPTADVVIPASSLAIIGLGDLHLTVPISQR